MSDWHQLQAAEVLKKLNSGPAGLSSNEAAGRLASNGPNQLVERGSKSPWLMLWEQLTSVMMVILIVAATVSAIMGDTKDAAVILVIVVLNAALGFSQEHRAEKAMAALKKLTVPKVRVRRDNAVAEIPALNLVAGDVILLEAGNIVPADCRMIETANLRIQESALTGESDAVEKSSEVFAGSDLPLGDRKNIGYMGTVVTYGRGTGAVVETGMRTELGRIAEMIQTVKQEPTPMQLRMRQLGRGLAIAAIGIVLVIFAAGMLRGEDLKLMFMTAISMAVAAVPEGLPAVMTVSLALGAHRMLKHRALIRKLPAVETLGSITVICSDKTGTLTQNRMTVVALDVAGHRLDLTVGQKANFPAGKENAFNLLLAAAALCNDAELKISTGPSDGTPVSGDPTEAALVSAAAAFGLHKNDLEKMLPRAAEKPFDSDRKRMTTVHHASAASPDILWVPGQDRPPFLSFTKGAVEGLLEASSGVWFEQKRHDLDKAWRDRIMKAHDELAQKGMRVLGVAFRPLDSAPSGPAMHQLETGLILLGLVGIMDPPRSEVKQAVHECRTAGIRPVMITGDHPLTAAHIAKELGISAQGRILTGQELSGMSVGELESVCEEVQIYARVSPEHKLKIIEAFQRRGHIVAMTGDGVNDAPALRKANIGIAMGITGTDVSKEASDMVLLDDNFATIVAAIKEGRVIYDNIRKFIKYLLTTNSGELWVMFAAPFVGMPLPLLPIQILWVNLMSDGIPALALGVEPPEKDVMRRMPAKPKENIFGHGLGRHILWVGILMGAVCLGAGFVYWRAGNPAWQTIVFNIMCLSSLCHVMAIRSDRYSLFQAGLFSNKPLLASVLFTFVMQLAVIYVPFFQSLFKTVPLSPKDMMICTCLSSIIFAAVECEKWFVRKKEIKE
jgi:Ca2+-transporting ATPase